MANFKVAIAPDAVIIQKICQGCKIYSSHSQKSAFWGHILLPTTTHVLTVMCNMEASFPGGVLFRVACTVVCLT